MNHKKLLLINKPLHYTSNDVLRIIKKTWKIKKAGHAGTLDPLATGLLIIGINEGTKLLSQIITDTKTYLCGIKFDYATTTFDNEGMITNYQHCEVFLKDLVNAIEYFKNEEYYQTPPQYSAIKINGKKAYELARDNIEVKLTPRHVHLYDYEIIEFEDNLLWIKIKVSKGFYVRSFSNDLGLRLNTYATLVSLCRTRVGDYRLEDAIDLKDLNKYV